MFIPFFDAARLNDYLQLAAQLRAAGLGVEVYPEPKKLGKQLQYADKRGFRVALMAGDNEFAAGQCQVKNLATGESTTVSLAGRRRRPSSPRFAASWQVSEIVYKASCSPSPLSSRHSSDFLANS